MRTWLLVAAIGVVLSGCAKKSSKEYFAAEREYQSLISSEGDDAYLNEQMAAVEARLRAIGDNLLEYDKAQALAGKIAAERARVQAEEAERARTLAAAAEPPPNFGAESPSFAPPPTTVPNVGVAMDAGTPDEKPSAGMPEADFVAKFRGCVSGPTPVEVDGFGSVPGYKVGAEPCGRKLGAPTGVSFFFVKGALVGHVSASTVRTVTATDGGVTTTTTERPGLIVPGAPLPPGYGGAPPPTSGSIAPSALPPSGLAPAGTGDSLAPRQNP